MIIIDGRRIATDILTRLSEEPKPERFLAAILVGDNASSLSFLAQKEKSAKKVGVDFRWYRFPADIKNDALREEVGKIAAHKTCGGVIVQLPLPAHLNRHYILNAIPVEKDVDVLSERSLGSFYADRNRIVPPAVGVLREILGSSRISQLAPLSSQSVAIVGLGLLVGRPIAVWIMRRAKETILLHQGSSFDALSRADLVISGVGYAGLLTMSLLKERAGIIDFGYEGGKGDFDPASTAESHINTPAFYTPTPGGTGPILVAKVLENFYILNRKAEI